MKVFNPLLKKENPFGKTVKKRIMKTVNTIGIVGAGTMGSALAQKFAQEKFNVILAERDIEFLAKAKKRIVTDLKDAVEKSVFSREQTDKVMNSIKCTVDLKELSSCDMIIEAVNEDFKVKADLFEKLSAIVDESTILCTNTSSFSVSELAKHVSHPERFVGVHYFYHAAKNRLVELAPGLKTKDETMSIVKSVANRSGKDAIVCKDSYGFVVNRFFVPWLNEAIRLLEEDIANIPTIEDVCMKSFGIGMGPFELMNSTGVAVTYHAEKTLAVFGPFYQVAKRLKEQIDTGKDWNLEGEISTDEEVRKIIRDRLFGAVFFVCLQLLDEKVCNAAEINRGARIGLRWKVGPIEWMQILGEKEVTGIVKQTVNRYKEKMPVSLSSQDWSMNYIELTKINGNAIIKINRPEDLNVLSEELLYQLDNKFTKALKDPEISQIFITGSGKAFVAGADIKFFVKNIKAGKLDDVLKFTAYGQKIFEKIDKSSKPVVTVLNGLTLGGGLEFALCADYIYALPGVKMSFPETGIGIYPGLGGTQRCAQRIGKPLSKYLILTGKTLSAKDALDIGLIDRIISPEEMDELFAGNVLERAKNKMPLSEHWRNIEKLFSQNTWDNFFNNQIQGNGLSPEDMRKLFDTVSRKAPRALALSEQLIDAADGCESELKHIHEIFSTKDALLGLLSPGRPVEFTGK